MQLQRAIPICYFVSDSVWWHVWMQARPRWTYLQWLWRSLLGRPYRPVLWWVLHKSQYWIADMFITLYKMDIQINIIFFHFSIKNICCGYSLKVSRHDASNVYPQHMFLWRNKTYTILKVWLKKLLIQNYTILYKTLRKHAYSNI